VSRLIAERTDWSGAAGGTANVMKVSSLEGCRVARNRGLGPEKI
jgi:hypothetical protein